MEPSIDSEGCKPEGGGRVSSQASPADLAADFAEAHYDEVFRYCARRLPTREDAQDAVQEVFLRLVRSRALYERRGKPLAYLYTCARNVCADFYRRQPPGARTAQVDEEALPDPAQGCAESRLVMKDALSRLDEEEREVVELRYGQDLSMADVARIVGKSRFAVRRIELKALDALRRTLGGD